LKNKIYLAHLSCDILEKNLVRLVRGFECSSSELLDTVKKSCGIRTRTSVSSVSLIASARLHLGKKRHQPSSYQCTVNIDPNPILGNGAFWKETCLGVGFRPTCLGSRNLCKRLFCQKTCTMHDFKAKDRTKRPTNARECAKMCKT